MDPVSLLFPQSVKKQPWILAYARMTEGEMTEKELSTNY